MAESASQLRTEGETHVSVQRTPDGIVCCVWWKLPNLFALDTATVYCCPLEPTRALCARDWSLAFKVYETSVYVSLVLPLAHLEVSFSLLTDDRRTPFVIMGGLEDWPGIYACAFPRCSFEDDFRKDVNSIVMCRVALTDEDAAKLDASTSRPCTCNTLGRDLEVIFLSQRFPDMRLVKGRTEFPVHRCFLSARSRKFCEALAREDLSGQNRFLLQYDASITDQAIVEALRFIYTGKTVDLYPDLAVPLFHVADELDLVDLKESCLAFLQCNITVSSFLGVLNLALAANCKSLKEEAELFFIKNRKRILKQCFPRKGRAMARPPGIKPQEYLILQMEIERLARVNMTSLFFDSD